jgi:hypothetical protein
MDNVVEDEFHFTIICSKLQSCEEFFKDICDVEPSFINMSDFDKFNSASLLLMIVFKFELVTLAVLSFVVFESD